MLHERKLVFPLQDFFLGNFKSIAVLRWANEELIEFLVKKSQRYGGARSCKTLQTILLDSSAISCSMVLNLNISISSLPGVPRLLLVKF